MVDFSSTMIGEPAEEKGPPEARRPFPNAAARPLR
jgi:hypothetical protein